MSLKVFGCRCPLNFDRFPLEFDDFEGLWMQISIELL